MIGSAVVVKIMPGVLACLKELVLRVNKVPAAVLIVISDKDRTAAVFKGANNLPGVEVEEISTLNTSLLAPGGDAGRLTVYTKSAIAKIGEWTE